MKMFAVVIFLHHDSEIVSRKEQAFLLESISRRALDLSAKEGGVRLGPLAKDLNNAPVPFDGHCWSISHKPKCVAAVAGPIRVGIDVEEVRPRAASLFNHVASRAEWQLSPSRSWLTFFRYWTAKEAVLKAVGIGLAGMKACRVLSLPDEDHVELEYQECRYLVEQLRQRDHIVSVLKDANEVEWVTLVSNGAQLSPAPNL
ncbi:MAG: 4'-phosphopantetheinyl transferase superfamily protein [Chloroflexi bacterium]|nr:4'-phosphopantetheinyl transferase superfamily protein [Chloroflexota bacterium]